MDCNTIEINETDFNEKKQLYLDSEIFRIHQHLEYSDFFCNFLLRNRPCLFSSEFTKNWASRRDWVTGGEGSTPNLNFIEKLLDEDVSVPVSDCNSRVRLRLSVGYSL